MIPSKHLQSDIIEVREDEKFNEEKLAEFLKDKLPNSKNPMKVKQFGGGAANLTYLLDFGDAEYVLRRPPLGPVAKGAHDMTREYRVLSVLHQDFPYAPRAHLFDDGAVIGSPFFIMDRRKGIVVRNKFPENFTDIPNAGRLISTSLIDRLAELHQVDYKKLNLEQLGKPEGFIERQVEGWYKRWNAAKHEDLKLMDELYLWLKSNYPNNPNYSIIHNDYKLDNVMIDSKDPGSIVAVFDWDMCTLGDPLSDLGALLAYWTDPSDPEYFKQFATMPVGDYGFLTREDLINRYQQKTGFSMKHINYYHVLALFRVVVIIAQIYIRFVRGQTQDQRFSRFGKIIPLIARAAVDLLNK